MDHQNWPVSSQVTWENNLSPLNEMHIHQKNHWNDIIFYWYQSYHWYQWTIGLTNRIRLCILHMGIWAYVTQCNDSNAFSASPPNTIWWWSTKSTRIVAVGSVCQNAHVQYTQLSSAHFPNYTKNNIRRISYISSLTLISCISFFMSPPISRTIFSVFRLVFCVI